jgi:hypothetical protein
MKRKDCQQEFSDNQRARNSGSESLSFFVSSNGAGGRAAILCSSCVRGAGCVKSGSLASRRGESLMNSLPLVYRLADFHSASKSGARMARQGSGM